MHDPRTLAHEIKIPLFFRREQKWLKSKKKEWQFYTLLTIWHVDPLKPGFGGSDDTCGWFMRAHHGDKEVLEKIKNRIGENFDRVFEYRKDDWNDDKKNAGAPPDSVHFMGYFCPNGDPNFSVTGIVLNMFYDAASVYFQSDGRTMWKKARKFMRDNLFDIMMFAENPTDSLRDGIVGTFRSSEKWRRDEALEGYASTIYGWILRSERPWWRHPKWHVHHWEFNCPLLLNLKRWLFSRCCKCGKGFSFGYSPVSNNWHSKGPRWFRSETDIYHSDCSRPSSYCAETSQKPA